MVTQNTLAAHIDTGKLKYAAASPFPHIVIDNFLPSDIADKIADDFPNHENDFWFRHTDVIRGKARTEKLASNDINKMPASIREILKYFNSSNFLISLSELTGIPNLIGDPDLEGGGMHLIRPGGFLEIHADFNLHDKLKLDRRINLLLYLNKNWKDEYGGELELWDKEMSRCVQKVLPVFNRCVIFSTTSDSYHGHPEKLRCPPEISRKSLAMYYYTDGRPDHEVNAKHSTLYQSRPLMARLKSWFAQARKF